MRRAPLLGLLSLLGWLVLPIGPARAANDPGLGKQWGLPMIGAPDAWATGTGAGVTIAVVDTGVDFQHVELKDKLVPGRNFVDPAKPPQDDNGHGTHVSGIAAAATNNGQGIAGVAPDARIMPLKALRADGFGESAWVEGAIRHAADNGAAVINLSLGDTGVTAILGPSFGQAVAYAWSKGSICVISSGNTNNTQYDFVTGPNFSSQNAVVVTALNRAGAKPSFAREIRSAKWGIAAPGGSNDGNVEDDVLSAWWAAGQSNTYAYAYGTSMSAPHVSGALAVLRSLGLSQQQAVDKLLATARDVGASGDDAVYGHGALDLKAAVAGLRPAGQGGGTGGTTPTTKGSTGTTQRPTGTTGPSPTTTAGGADLPIVNPGADGTGTPDTTATDDEDDGPSAQAAGGGGGSDRDDDGDGDDRPWPALAVAALVLAGAVAKLAGVIRPKPT